MQTVEAHTENTLEIKQSKFITHLMPFSMFEAVLAKLKEEHPKARHFVSAFRYLNEHEQVVEGSSDDGEPKGTSGKPTLAVLQGHGLINAAVITVRYFGGTKLGTGGLVRAYSDATNLVIENAQVVDYRKELCHCVGVAYSDIGLVEYELKQYGLRITEKKFEASEALFTLSGTQEGFERFFEAAGRLVRRMERPG